MNQNESNNVQTKENWHTFLTRLINQTIIRKYLTICETGKNEICPITFVEIEHPVKTSCNHVFEKDFIIQWIRERKNCPLCRKELDTFS